MQRTRAHVVHFLLVEDDQDHAELVRRGLESSRVVNDLTHVTDGEEAIRLLRLLPPYEKTRRPDVVLLDIKLPRMNGLEVLELIKSDETLSSIPVVMLTTSEAETDRARAYARSANSYLVKPLHFEQFHQMIQDLQMYWAVWNQPPIVPA
jgi:CheY-like chemotaxis protein